MSVEADWRWFTTTHHELGHIYYYLSYTNDDVPPLMREGANRSYHEGIGDHHRARGGCSSPPTSRTRRPLSGPMRRPWQRMGR
jgi:hypothetical protein